MSDENTAAEPEPDDRRSDHPDGHSDDGAMPEAASGEHAAPDGAPLHPLIDLSRDPTPGEPDHARPDDE